MDVSQRVDVTVLGEVIWGRGLVDKLQSDCEEEECHSGGMVTCEECCVRGVVGGVAGHVRGVAGGQETAAASAKAKGIDR